MIATLDSHRARFEREALAISALSHPRICTLYDMGEHAGTPFLVMEHLTGETLATHLRKGPLALQRAIQVGVEIAEGLSAAHRQGIVHRDLRPSNVMLTRSGVKLLDFGIARIVEAERTPNADPDHVPDVQCAFLRTSLEYRDRFPCQREPAEGHV